MAEPAQKPRKKPDWAAMERASLEYDRELFRNTTPGQRVEMQLRHLSELTALAERGRRRK